MSHAIACVGVNGIVHYKASVTHHEGTFFYITSLTLSVIEYFTVKFPILHKVTVEWELFRKPARCF